MGILYKLFQREHLGLLLMSMCSISYGANGSTNGEEQAKAAYDTNCKACHALDTFSTGPSLVYIRDQYPLAKRDAFLSWVKKPGKKNPDTIQMPPMPHIADKDLAQIHNYILFVSKHIKEQRAKAKFTPFHAPPRPYPQIVRTYMPFTSPASIRVNLNPELAIAWDTTIGKIRYAFPATKAFSGEKKREENKSDILYQETTTLPFSILDGYDIDFKGYDVVDGNPEFIYHAGPIQVREKITLGGSPKSFVRHYSITGVFSDVTLDLNHIGKADINTNKGRLIKNTLHLTADEAAQFSVEVSLR